MNKGGSKTSVRRKPLTGSLVSAAVSFEDELAAMREVSDYLRSNPDKLAKLAVEMGIHTRTGKLGKTYGG